ncbi:hypothetical protein R1flu_021941 [Riccia fluitans]|uniref:Uncharacterized protein n=1 Tax=Riccia fluitans TaxID=41844 RepID=A0ABD1ZQU7_9MARC
METPEASSPCTLGDTSQLVTGMEDEFESVSDTPTTSTPSDTSQVSNGTEAEMESILEPPITSNPGTSTPLETSQPSTGMEPELGSVLEPHTTNSPNTAGSQLEAELEPVLEPPDATSLCTPGDPSQFVTGVDAQFGSVLELPETVLAGAPRSNSRLFTSMEAMNGSAMDANGVVCDEDREIARRFDAWRRASELRDRKRKEISARRPKPKVLDFLKHRLGEVVDPKDWTPNWVGYMRGEKHEWWTPISEDGPWIHFIKHQEDLVVGCPKKDHHTRLCP